MADGGGSSGAELLDEIRGEVRQCGPLTFARFMELALYHPVHGYYTRGPHGLGPGGDYVTASDAGHALGGCLAGQLAEVDRLAGPYDPFDVIEFGAGRGLLARDVLDAMPAVSEPLAGRLRYTMIDRSRAMRAAARRAAPEALVLEREPTGARRRGVVVAVELFDALPVHRVRRRAGELVELRVDCDEGGRLVEREGRLDEGLAALAERYGAAAEEGSEAELSPRVVPMLRRMAGVLEQGVWVVIDYGHGAQELYGPARRRGTLVAYHRNRVHDELLERVGGQDLTAHVNFTQLEDVARAEGLEVLGNTTQDRFLIANGILERLEVRDESDYRDPARIKERLQAKQLIHPEGMGRAFRVLLLARGCRPRLSGLRDPFG